MTDWVSVADESAIPEGTGATYFVDDVEVAVFRSDGRWHAIEGRCPHKGASLGKGPVEGCVVTCPWHDWKFDLTTGEGLTHSGSNVATVSVRVADGTVQIDRASLPAKPDLKTSVDDGVHRYLVRYGALGWVGLFGTVDRVECRHKDHVVVQTHRGVELGEILSDPDDHSVHSDGGQPAGEVQRVASPDELQEHQTRSSELTPQLIEESAACLAAAGVDLAIVDGEVLFDGESAVLYFLGDSNPDAGPLVTEVARHHGLERIELQPMIDPPVPEGGGCGKPGCGGGGCHS